MTSLSLLCAGSSAFPSELVLKGRVVDGRGFPLTQARVYMEGARKAGGGTDRDGWYSFKLEVPSLEQLQDSPIEITLGAYRRGWAVALESGFGWRLRLEISALPDTDRVLCYRLRSNDSTAAAQLAELTVLEGKVAGTLLVHFVGGTGEQPTVKEPLTIEQKVRITGAKAASKASAAVAPPAASASTRTAPKPPTPSSTSNPAATPVAPLLTPISRATVPTYAPGCTCRVEGTVEVNTERVNDPLDVVVWFESAPRDSQRVHMFMGAPREFRLTARGCGSHLLRYAVRSKGRQQYQAARDVIVDCTDRGLRQPRLVLQPAPRRK